MIYLSACNGENMVLPSALQTISYIFTITRGQCHKQLVCGLLSLVRLLVLPATERSKVMR